MAFYTSVRQYGNNILYLGYDDNGNRVKEKIAYSPDLYLPDVKDRNEGFSHYDGTKLFRKEFHSINDAKSFIHSNSNVENFNIYGQTNFASAYITNKFKSEIKSDFSLIRRQFIDIENKAPNGVPDPYLALYEITLITVFDSYLNEYHIFGCKDYTPKGSNHIYHRSLSEHNMLHDFLLWMTEHRCDIITGWNIRAYDIPYIVNRMNSILGEDLTKKLSPWGIINKLNKKVKRFGRMVDQLVYEIEGVAELDYLDLYQKFYLKAEESYKLDYILQKNLGRGKISFKGTLDELYESDFEKYTDYNIRDVEGVFELDNKLQYIDLVIELAYIAKVPKFTDALGSVKYWEILIYNHLANQNTYTPIKKHNDDIDGAEYEAAFVLEPNPGLYDWIMSYDVQSLYPSVIRQSNIGPDTIVERHTLPMEVQIELSKVDYDNLSTNTFDTTIFKKHNLSLCANKCVFSHHKQSFLSELMEMLFAKRKEYKNLMKDAEREYVRTNDPKYLKLVILYNIKQQAMKICLNSAYGATGNKYFQYYSLDIATAITLTGQAIIKHFRIKLNQFMNKMNKTIDKDYIVYIDTDSLYVDFKSIIEKNSDKFSKTEDAIEFLDRLSIKYIEPFIDSSSDAFKEYLNSYTKNIYFSRDVICDKVFWRSKKNYAMNVWDSEGTRYNNPELVVKGLESKKSSTSKLAREHLDESYKIILRQDEKTLKEYVSKVKEIYRGLTPDELAQPKKLNDIKKYTDIATGSYTKGCPNHVRAAILHNNLVKKHNLTNSVDILNDGSTFKIVNLTLPNVINEDVIAFQDELPAEFNLDNCLDYQLVFDKSFIKPLKGVTDAIGWGIEDSVVDMDDWLF